MIYLYGTGSDTDTIAKISSLLRCKYGTTPADNDFIIGWGMSISNGYGSLNKSIHLNKFKAHKLLAKKVKVPVLWEKAEDIPSSAFPVLGRDKNHSCGTDIVYIESPDAMVKKDFYVQFVPKIAEIRAHVLGDKIYLSQKIPKHKTYDKIIWNNSHGYTYLDITGSTLGWYKNFLVRYSAKRAIRALGYDFGAVDIIISEVEYLNRVFVLEVNSAPGLIDRRAKWYAEYFKSMTKPRISIYKKILSKLKSLSL